MKKIASTNRLLSLLLAFVMLLGMTPGVANASEKTTYKFGANETALAPGSYELGVALKKASDIKSDSMAASCIKGGSLTVAENGSATVKVNLGPVAAFGITGYASDWKIYQEYNYNSSTDLIAAEFTTATENETSFTNSISFTLPDNSWDGVYVSMFIDVMGVNQDAYIAFTYPESSVKDDVRSGTAKVEQFGKYDVSVKVTVEDDKIKSIDIQGSNFTGNSAEKNKQTLASAIEGLKDFWNDKSITDAEGIYNVDVVSGATTSSKAIRNAVMDALKLTYEEDSITLPDSVKPGKYTVPVSYYTGTVLHYLTGKEKSDASLTVADDGSMTMEFALSSGTDAEPLYLLDIAGYYENNDKTAPLSKKGMSVTMSDTDFSDKYFSEDTKVVSKLIVPLTGKISKEYATNVKLYVPAMNSLNGEISGIVFENGTFNVDSFIKIYWDDIKTDSSGSLFDRPEGKYKVDTELSCFISAMGGVEFADGLYKGASVKINKDGSASMTLSFGTSSLTIYGQKTNTYVGEGRYYSGATADAYTGYKDKNDQWVKINDYTLSGAGKTVMSSYKQSVQYITDITFPIEEITDTYDLAMVIDSDFMGMQFGYDSKYNSVLTVDWNTLKGESNPVTIENSIGGTIKADIAEAEAGKTVALTVTPSENFELSSLTYTPEGGESVNIEYKDGVYSFKMPASPVTVNASFSLKAGAYNVPVKSLKSKAPLQPVASAFNGAFGTHVLLRVSENGTSTITADNKHMLIDFTSLGMGKFDANVCRIDGEGVVIHTTQNTVYTNVNGKLMDSSAHTQTNITVPGRFTIPAALDKTGSQKITIGVDFMAAMNGVPADDYSTEVTLTLDLDKAVNAEKTITVADSENGSVKANCEKAVPGDTVVLTVTPADNYKLSSFKYTPEGKEAVSIEAVNGVYSFKMPEFNVTVNAEFEKTSSGNGTGSGGGSSNPDSFFLKDGKYYVEIALWKKDTDKTSMGDVAFKNNRKALVTVNNGKITNVQISTNPVKVGTYYSAVTKIDITGASVKVLDTEKITTKNGDKELNKYDYIKTFSFTMPSDKQPANADKNTYVNVSFIVPDTPMDDAVDGALEARLVFDWNSAEKTNDSSMSGNSSTASGSSSITGKDVEDIELIDKATGIRLKTDTEHLDSAAELKVSSITEGADYINASKAMSSVNKTWKLMKITTEKAGKTISPNGSVTISIPCTKDGLTVYRINNSGSKTVIKGQLKDGHCVFDTSVLGLFAIVGELAEAPAVSDSGFTDITGHWAEKYIKTAVKLNLFSGTGKTTFSPDAAMTRGMFVTVLGRLSKADAENGKTNFTDVDPDMYYAPYIAWANKNGIVNGITETTFMPERPITRQEMACILARYCKFAKIELKGSANISFADAGKIAGWAADDVANIAGAGLINGTGDNMFSPENTATRAQVAALLVRFIENYNL